MRDRFSGNGDFLVEEEQLPYFQLEVRRSFLAPISCRTFWMAEFRIASLCRYSSRSSVTRLDRFAQSSLWSQQTELWLPVQLDVDLGGKIRPLMAVPIIIPINVSRSRMNEIASGNEHQEDDDV